MKAHFEMMAAYNAWANGRLYDASHALADADYRADCQTAFHSVHGTLNHLLVADTIWMSRFRGLPNPPWTLDHIVKDDRAGLRKRREAMDRDIIGYVHALSDAALAGDVTYLTIIEPERITQPLTPALAHFFNHQTHHRGQCHAMLTRLTGSAPEMDLLFFFREA